MTERPRNPAATPPRARASADIGVLLRAWLLGGLALCLLLPPLRGSSDWFGWWPLWLVVTPLVGAFVLASEPRRELRGFAMLLTGTFLERAAQARRVRRRAAR
jgi:hypothetical protein